MKKSDQSQKDPAFVPATVAAIRLGRTRERVVRAVQRGELKGKREDGRWFVDESELENAPA